jgi:hypothetical protein
MQIVQRQLWRKGRRRRRRKKGRKKERKRRRRRRRRRRRGVRGGAICASTTLSTRAITNNKRGEKEISKIHIFIKMVEIKQKKIIFSVLKDVLLTAIISKNHISSKDDNWRAKGHHDNRNH